MANILMPHKQEAVVEDHLIQKLALVVGLVVLLDQNLVVVGVVAPTMWVLVCSPLYLPLFQRYLARAAVMDLA